MGCTQQIAFWGGAPGGFELLLVFAVALMLFGAKRLPEIARVLGRLLEQARDSMQQFSDEIIEADEPRRPRLPEVPASRNENDDQGR